MERPLTVIARLGEELFRSLPKGTPESNKAFQIWKLATDGDARELRDDPTVRAAKKRTKKPLK